MKYFHYAFFLIASLLMPAYASAFVCGSSGTFPSPAGPESQSHAYTTCMTLSAEVIAWEHTPCEFDNTWSRCNHVATGTNTGYYQFRSRDADYIGRFHTYSYDTNVPEPDPIPEPGTPVDNPLVMDIVPQDPDGPLVINIYGDEYKAELNGNEVAFVPGTMEVHTNENGDHVYTGDFVYTGEPAQPGQPSISPDPQTLTPIPDTPTQTQNFEQTSHDVQQVGDNVHETTTSYEQISQSEYKETKVNPDGSTTTTIHQTKDLTTNTQVETLTAPDGSKTETKTETQNYTNQGTVTINNHVNNHTHIVGSGPTGATGQTTTTTQTDGQGNVIGKSTTSTGGDPEGQSDKDKEGEDENDLGEVTGYTSGGLYECEGETCGKTMSDVWDTHKAALMETPLISGIQDTFAVNVGGGSCPSWTFNLNIPGLGNFGAHELSPPCWLWDVIGLFIMLTALFTARALIFGG